MSVARVTELSCTSTQSFEDAIRQGIDRANKTLRQVRSVWIKGQRVNIGRDGTLETARGIEMGHIFQLGRKYADALDLRVLDENGKLVTVTMGSYGIGVSRAVAAIAENTHDELGLVWPREVSPADVHLVATGKDDAVYEAAQALADNLQEQGLTVLYDDRPKVSPGVKFKDAELIGVPTIVVVGKGLTDGVIEVKDRATGERADVSLDEAPRHVVQVVRG